MAKKTNYLGNVVKEVKQTARSASNAVDKYLNGNRPLPKGIKIGKSNVKSEAGQLAGAVLQGRRYDASGKQIVVGKTGARQVKKIAKTSISRKTRGAVPTPKKVTTGTKPRKPRGARPTRKGM